MIWYFTRQSAQVDIEVRRLPADGRFELVIDYPDGSEEVERFHDPRKLVKRTLSVQQRLIRDGWVPTGPGGHRFGRDKRATSRRGAVRLKTMPGVVWRYVRQRVKRRLAAMF